jgi:long-subunit acyl-CoA synthetase (AMP-forming)
MAQYNIKTDEREFGDYIWQTYQETDDIVEAFARTLVKRKLCPVIKSETEGTPDVKFLAIFSENRRQWFMTELAACSDSICIVPVAVET